MLIESYSSTRLEDSTVLSIANVGVVVLSGFIGFSLFKEKLTNRKIIGLLCSILAIGILFWAQN
jgi:drug/metabolite transporter (DMT)-like permease